MTINDEPKDWAPVGKALSNLPLPPPCERFVQGVMSRIQAEERPKLSWLDLWKIPAVGFGMAAALLVMMLTFWSPTNFQDPLMAQWAESDEASDPDRNEVLQFTLEESEGDL